MLTNTCVWRSSALIVFAWRSGEEEDGGEVCARGVHDQGAQVRGQAEVPHRVREHPHQAFLYRGGIPHSYRAMVGRLSFYHTI